MKWTRAIWPGLALMLGSPATAQMCQLCATQPDAQAAPVRPIRIEIETVLDFSLAAHSSAGAGQIELDARTGQRRLVGLIGVGGPAMRGVVRITGEPFRRVQIEMPTRIRLNSTLGAKADVDNIRTTLGAAPAIGADGTLTFHFGGTLSVMDDAAGDFHGRVRIDAQYE